MVAGEGREGARWFAGQIGDNACDRLGRTARALVRGDRRQAGDQPRWLAGSRETCARLVNGFVDETQWPANRLAQMSVACRYESASPPVMTYFFPVCPGSLSVTAATAAMSRVSTN